MARYIDADNLKEDIAGARIIQKPKYLDAEETLSIIDMQPTADVVEVVRCKNCKHFDSHPEGLYGDCTLSGDYQGNYEYCSYGERKF